MSNQMFFTDCLGFSFDEDSNNIMIYLIDYSDDNSMSLTILDMITIDEWKELYKFLDERTK
jgi:hypothetical protein